MDGVIFCKAGYYKKAIKYHKRSLTSYVLTLPLDHLATSCICEHLGDVFRRMGKQKIARQYYDEPERMAREHLNLVEKL